MDIRTTPPEQYAQWLLSQGVAPERLRDRLAHDALRAMVKTMEETGTPNGFEELKSGAENVLAEDAIARARRQ